MKSWRSSSLGVLIFVFLLGINLVTFFSNQNPVLAQTSSCTSINLYSRVSVGPNQTQANNSSNSASVSADGRYIAYTSTATNIVAGDTNDHSDVFVYDRTTCQTKRVSVATDGTQGNGDSDAAQISGNGRYVVFQSNASNLVPNDTNNRPDTLVYDLYTGQITRVSVSSTGAQGVANKVVGQPDPEANGDYNDLYTLRDLPAPRPSISADGRYVAFTSTLIGLTAQYNAKCSDGQTPYFYLCSQVYLHDMTTGQTTLLSAAPDGTAGDGNSHGPAISDDGKYVVFNSHASNLRTPAMEKCNYGSSIQITTGCGGIYLRDISAGTLTYIAHSDSLYNTTLSNPNSLPSISGNGQYIAFASFYPLPGDYTAHTCGTSDFAHNCTAIYRFDRSSKGLISIRPFAANQADEYEAPTLSSTGQYVAYESAHINADNSRTFALYLQDMTSRTITRIDTLPDGSAPAGQALGPILAGNMNVTLFSSSVNGYVSDDTNNVADVFARALTSTTSSGGTTTPSPLSGTPTFAPPTNTPAGPTQTPAPLNPTNSTPTNSTTVRLKLQYMTGTTAAWTVYLKPYFKVVNFGGTAVALKDITVRYWYTLEWPQPEVMQCVYAAFGCSNLNGTFGAISPATSAANRYIEYHFKDAAGNLAAYSSTGAIMTQFYKPDNSGYLQKGDYSYDPNRTTYADYTRIGVYYKGQLVWGTAP